MRRRAAQAAQTMHIRSTELCRTPPASLDDDQFVAQLGSVGLGSTSYVVGRRDPHAPEWIVLDYATGGHERVWRRTRPQTDGLLAYVLVEDDSSNGYVSAA
ncbi:hypothetical protein ACIPJ1_12610 [Microbacterium maritypicum]|uniref:Uncharacterized protein n=1 Tax=Microbacterium maritypicum MF109 TaxID=1333857 RepID=T5KDS4_MICMQ|nr:MULTISPECIES: hypothetical protein [Microbacterium]EQM73026.1 hypothetical protein L687_07050 [Microbacterium maritypicum MF109]MCV0336251.1 hypothetical protein [Microbacterium sp.]MCV0376543.1 hypothetical protein [Microbacterium sp.]MCV0390972.1 hypothetical protein [Microbacterium sp.]MCV0419809.1 hypothetical protein [Microbacterium sp.]